MAQSGAKPKRKPPTGSKRSGRNGRARRPLGPPPGMTVTFKGDPPEPGSEADPKVMAARELFLTVTGVEAADLYTGPDRTLYVVAQERYKAALASSFKAKRELLREQLGHPVEIISAAESAEGFTSNVFAPFKPDSVEVIKAPTGTIVHVSLPLDTKGRAIGRGGTRLAAARELILRAHDVKELVVT